METRNTFWCSVHDTEFRSIRTSDDRIVCWYVWWTYVTTPMGEYLPCKPELVVIVPDRRQS